MAEPGKDSSDEKDEGRSDLPVKTITGVLVVVLLVWIGGGIVPLWYYGFDAAQAGPLGDTFGATNALFTGLAFAGVIATILLQMRELKLQRQEMRDAREEMKGSRTAPANCSIERNPNADPSLATASATKAPSFST
jgi:hypothetical protein